MLKFNFEKLSEVEEKYKNNGISIDTLQRMVELVMDPRIDPMLEKNNSARQLALNTLKELGIISETKNKKIKQLNS